MQTTNNKCEERMGQTQRIHIQAAISPAATARTNPHENQTKIVWYEKGRRLNSPNRQYCSWYFFVQSSIFSMRLVLIWFLCFLLFHSVAVRYELRAVNCASSRNIRTNALVGKRVNVLELRENQFIINRTLARPRPAYNTIFEQFLETFWKGKHGSNLG